jgi:hypothetical protein
MQLSLECKQTLTTDPRGSENRQASIMAIELEMVRYVLSDNQIRYRDPL